MAVFVLLLLISVVDTVKGSRPWFVKTGSDLLLDVDTIQKGFVFTWKCNSDVVVVFPDGSEPLVVGKYQGRASFFKQNFSLVISNVQHNDSGNYRATATGDKERIVADYTVTVQDPVYPVKLTINLSDARYCNFTATCRVMDSEVSGIYQCYNQTCHPLNKPDVKDSSLTVYIQEGSVACNHSNYVSWTNDTKSLVSPCKNEPARNAGSIVGKSAAAVITAVIAGVLIFWLFKRWKGKRSAHTVYEVPQENPQTNPYESPAEVPTSSSPTSTYALVQFSHHLDQPNDTGTCPNKQPETIYAQVNRADKNKSKPATSNR